MVVTAQSDGSAVRSLLLIRGDRHRFTTTADLVEGMNRVVVIARTETGARLRAVFELNLPNGG
jgi:hypothetical protein